MNWANYWENKRANSVLPSIMTKHHNINQYTEWLQDKNLSENTIRTYLSLLDKFPQEFSTDNLREYFRANFKKYEATSLKLQQRAFNSYIKFKKLNIEWEKIVRLIPRIQRKFFDTIDDKELAILEATRVEKSEIIWKRNSLIMRFLLYSGVRITELINLKHSDWKGNQCRIHGKGNKIRHIPLPPFLIEHFNLASADYLFVNGRGKPIKAEYIRWLLKARTKKSGLSKKITPHTFRRSFATMLHRNGTQLLTIKQLLGHDSVQTTERYIQNDFEYIYQDYSKLWKK